MKTKKKSRTLKSERTEGTSRVGLRCVINKEKLRRYVMPLLTSIPLKNCCFYNQGHLYNRLNSNIFSQSEEVTIMNKTHNILCLQHGKLLSTQLLHAKDKIKRYCPINTTTNKTDTVCRVSTIVNKTTICSISGSLPFTQL